MSKRLLLKLGLVALLGAGLFVAWLWWTTPRHRINREGFDGIDAMSYAEVVEFLGCPPRYKPGELRSSFLDATFLSMKLEAMGFVWQSHEARLYVAFNDDGKVWGKMLCSGTYEVSLLDKLRRWLHLD